jgi:LacI family transcriptional regulator
MPLPVTMQALAREAGVSQSTVSLALRDDPRVAAKTRARIQELARLRGYQPDPALSALVAYRARTRPPGDYGKIAMLHDWDRPLERFPLAMRQSSYGLIERAAQLGYEVELFRVPEDGLALSRVLYHRGIRGVILHSLRLEAFEMEWEHFSAVAIGEYFCRPQLNHVNHHLVRVLVTAYQELRRRGYKRIGYCNIGISEERKHHLYLGAYLQCLHVDGINPADSPPFFYEEANWCPLAWLDANGFDAVLNSTPARLLEKLEGTRYKVPENLGVAGFSLPVRGMDEHISSCVVDFSRIGSIAVDLLQTMMHSGQRGVPPLNEHYDLMLGGRWRDGVTLRAASG